MDTGDSRGTQFRITHIVTSTGGEGGQVLARRKMWGRLTPPSKILQIANPSSQSSLSSISHSSVSSVSSVYSTRRFLLDASTFPTHFVDMSTPVAYDLQGQNGSTVLGAGHSYSGNIRWIQVVNDAVLSSVASASGNVANPTRLQSITLPAGLGIGGRFSSVAVTSGVVVVYFE